MGFWEFEPHSVLPCPAEGSGENGQGGHALPVSCPLLSGPPGRKEQLRPELPEVPEGAISTHPPRT